MIFDKGAEAIIEKVTLCGINLLRKRRVKKEYREPILDNKLRRERTRTEARILHRVKSAGVLCPVVYLVEGYDLYITKFKGKTLNKLKIRDDELRDMGKYLARIHSVDVVHSDYTRANVMRTERGTAVIDFGLAYTSKRIEDKANDVVTLIQDLGNDHKIRKVIDSYLANGGDEKVVARAYDILKRGRYQKNQKTNSTYT